MKRSGFLNRYSTLYITFLSLIAILIAIPWLYSVFKSAYGYQFDADELHHANLVYLYTKGFIPYRDIYNSFYTPLFEWTLLPVFLVFGFSFKTIIFSRFIMIIFFIVRLSSLYILIQTLWSKRAALLFIPLLLFDPFAVISSFQIRTDNFMLMLYSIGLAAATVGVVGQKRNPILVGSFFLGLSLLSLPKILPAVIILTSVLVIQSVLQKKYSTAALILFCTILPTLLFLLYGSVTGGLYEMVQQMVIESKSAYAIFRAPLPFGALFFPENLWVYGTMGKPITWMYMWILPLLGAGGLFSYILSFLALEKTSASEWIKFTLAVTLIVQFISLIFLPVVFMQHYLLINWLYALFAATFFDNMLTVLNKKIFLSLFLTTGLFLLYSMFARTSYTYNTARSTIHGQELIDAYEKRLAQIPENESVFPHFLFRPPIYPVPFGYYIGNVPTEILNRLPDIPNLLEEKKVQKLLLDDYTLGLMPMNIQTYIAAHYFRVPGDNELMVRK